MLSIRNRTEMAVFVVLASLAAMSSSSILASATYELFRPVTERANLLHIIFITALIAVPIAFLLALHSMRITRYQSELEDLANTDALTGLHNRRRFLELLPQEGEDARRTVIAFVDLDRFKSINDRFGHAVGDEVFKTVAGRLQAFRPALSAARLGGDEFALMIDEGDLASDPASIVAPVRREICRPVDTSTGRISVGASIGLAVFPDDAATPSELLRAADRAMLRAKAGGGGICRFTASLDAEATDEQEIEARLRTVITSRGITPAYQPVICTATRAVVGHEVLARWTAEARGDAPSPGRFIPIAERVGLIDELFWSLLEQVLSGPAARAPDGVIALNVSPNQLHHDNFADRLATQLVRHKYDPSRLELEVTETAMFRDMETGIDVLRRIAERGVSISLDDFGTGHSSLSLVRQLPLTKLKIDKSFISPLIWSSHSESIVSATVSLCQALGLKTCAEGVEDERTFLRLQELGCDYVQGFHLGRPNPVPAACDAPAQKEALKAVAAKTAVLARKLA